MNSLSLNKEKLKMSKQGRVQVFARSRPFLERENGDFSPLSLETERGRISVNTSFDNAVTDVLKNCGKNSENKEKVPGEHGQVEREKVYHLDGVFAEEVSQKEVFTTVGLPVLVDVMSGFNGCIFAYGQTGSGKTHSLLNTDANDTDLVGLLPRLVATLYVRASMDRTYIYKMEAAAFQVYNEQVDDLLTQGSGKGINLSVSKGTVKDLSWVPCKAASDMLDVFQRGRKGIHYAETKMNKASSRSHAIFQIRITKRLRVQPKTENDNAKCFVKVTCGKLSVVDLAGSERVKKSGVTGSGFKEATNINGSLLALGNVISALANRRKHVPFRDSKLTRILEGSVGGNCKTSLLVCVSPAQNSVNETLSTLDFATRAMRVEVSAVVNEQEIEMDISQLAADLLNQDEMFVMNEETMKTYKESEEALQKAKEKSEMQERRVHQLESALAKANEEIQGKTNYCHNLEQRVQTLQKKSKEQQQKLSYLEECLGEKSEKIKFESKQKLQVQEKLIEKQNEYSLLVSRLGEIKEKLVNEINTLKTDNDDTKAKLELKHKELKYEKENSHRLQAMLKQQESESKIRINAGAVEYHELVQKKNKLEENFEKQIKHIEDRLKDTELMKNNQTAEIIKLRDTIEEQREKIRKTEHEMENLKKSLREKTETNQSFARREILRDNEIKTIEARYEQQESYKSTLEKKVETLNRELEQYQADGLKYLSESDMLEAKLRKADLTIGSLEISNKRFKDELYEYRDILKSTKISHKDEIEQTKQHFTAKLEKMKILHNKQKEMSAKYTAEELHIAKTQAEEAYEALQSKFYKAQIDIEQIREENQKKTLMMRETLRQNEKIAIEKEKQLRDIFSKNETHLKFAHHRQIVLFQAAALAASKEFEKRFIMQEKKHAKLLSRFNSRESRSEDIKYISKQRKILRHKQNKLDDLKREVVQKDLELKNIRQTVRIFGDLKAEENKKRTQLRPNQRQARTPKGKRISFFSEKTKAAAKIRPYTATTVSGSRRNNTDDRVETKDTTYSVKTRRRMSQRPLPQPDSF